MWQTQRSSGSQPEEALPHESRGTSPLREDNLDMALDVLAAILRDFGKHAFPLPDSEASDLSARCEQWAQHILFASPRPDEAGQERSAAGGKRDWSGLRAFFEQHRCRESQYVTEALSGMQQALWTFVQGLDEALLGEHSADARIQAQLDRLKAVVQSHSVADIRQEVLTSVEAMSQIMDERKESQRRQMEELRLQIRDLHGQLKEERKASALDALTTLYNRKAFDEHLEQALQMRLLFEQPACLLIVDADHFKSINDTHGHAAGDAVLKGLADCLALTFLSKDDCVARYGGEEFGIIITDATAADGRRIGERLLQAIRALGIAHGGRPIPVTISIGLAEAQADDTAASWLERADRALYSAKQGGRNRMEEG